jgi:hypothetical protein
VAALAALAIAWTLFLLVASAVVLLSCAVLAARVRAYGGLRPEAAALAGAAIVAAGCSGAGLAAGVPAVTVFVVLAHWGTRAPPHHHRPR